MKIDSCNRPLGVWTGRPGGLRSDGRRQAPSERCCCVSQSSHDDTAGSPGMYRRVCDGIHNPSNRRQTKPREHTSVTLRVSTHTQTYRLAANRPMTTVIQRITHATAYAIRHTTSHTTPRFPHPSRYVCADMHGSLHRRQVATERRISVTIRMREHAQPAPRHQPFPKKPRNLILAAFKQISTAMSLRTIALPVARPVAMSSLTVCPQPNGQYGNL